MKKIVNVSFTVQVEVNEAKFTLDFMQGFREAFYQFDTIDDHIKHLAQLYVRHGFWCGTFIEGYGIADDMGIKAQIIDQEEEIV